MNSKFTLLPNSAKALAICFSLSASWCSAATGLIDHLSLDFVSSSQGITQATYTTTTIGGAYDQTWTHLGGPAAIEGFFLDEVTMVSGTTVGFHLGLEGIELDRTFGQGSDLGEDGTVISGPGGEEWVVPAGRGNPRPVFRAGKFAIDELSLEVELTLTFGNLTPSSLYSVVFWSGDPDLNEAVDGFSEYCIPADGAGELAFPFFDDDARTPFAALQISECGCTAPSVIPEPGSLAFAFLGLTLLGFRRTRR